MKLNTLGATQQYALNKWIESMGADAAWAMPAKELAGKATEFLKFLVTECNASSARGVVWPRPKTVKVPETGSSHDLLYIGLADHAESIAKLESKVNELLFKLSLLTGTVAGAEKRLTGIDCDLNEATGRIVALEKKVEGRLL